MPFDKSQFKKQGADFPPFINLHNKEGKPGARLVAKFLSYRELTKGAGKEKRDFNFFRVQALEGTSGIAGVEIGREYTVSASGMLLHLLTPLAAGGESMKGATFYAEYLGKRKITGKHKFAGQDAHQYEVGIAEK